MKKFIAALLGCVLLAGCQPPDTNKTYKISVSTQLQEEIRQEAIYEKTTLSRAKNNVEIAKLDSEANLIKAKAQVEINKMIQDSIQDKALLKNWNLGTDGVSWSRDQVTARTTGIPTTFGQCWSQSANGTYYSCN